MKDPYKVLGVDKSADPDKLKTRYEELRALYGEQRFCSGEKGNEGARKLQELEEAWALIGSDVQSSTINATFSGNYSVIDELIRQGKYDDAQSMLDGIRDRSGEWHYMQAIVFYKREWLSDAKTQLEMALREDPDNAKYRSSLDKLMLTMGIGSDAGNSDHFDSPRNSGASGNNGQRNNPPPYTSEPQQPDAADNCLSTMCCAYCLSDCLCNMMRCC